METVLFFVIKYEKGISFELKVPNAETIKVMEEALLKEAFIDSIHKINKEK